VHELQRGDDTRWRWVNYSAYDAKSTHDLYQRLRQELKAMPAELDDAVRDDYRQVGGRGLVAGPWLRPSLPSPKPVDAAWA
jgi:hypothetical protein